MKRTATARHIACPECNTSTKVTCLKYGDEGTLRIRYRKCPSCNHKLRTKQTISPSVGPEVITPYPTEEERRISHAFDNTSLTEIEVLEIMAHLKEGSWLREDIAWEYKVSTCVIRDIALGVTFKHLTAASS